MLKQKKQLSPKQREELLAALKARFEINLNRQKLDVVNKTQSNPVSRDWRGHFTPEFKPLEFEGFGNCGESAIIKDPTGERQP